MFETRKELQSKLSASEAEVARLEAENTALQSKVDEAAGSAQVVAELQDDIEAAKAQISAEEAAHAATKEAAQAREEELTNELNAEKDKTTPEAIQALVTAEVCKAGIPPIAELAENASKPDLKTMSREAFNQLSPRQRSEFSIKGGTITD